MPETRFIDSCTRSFRKIIRKVCIQFRVCSFLVLRGNWIYLLIFPKILQLWICSFISILSKLNCVSILFPSKRCSTFYLGINLDRTQQKILWNHPLSLLYLCMFMYKRKWYKKVKNVSRLARAVSTPLWACTKTNNLKLEKFIIKLVQMISRKRKNEKGANLMYALFRVAWEDRRSEARVFGCKSEPFFVPPLTWTEVFKNFDYSSFFLFIREMKPWNHLFGFLENENHEFLKLSNDSLISIVEIF